MDHGLDPTQHSEIDPSYYRWPEQLYPYSHHGTPHQEHNEFSWSSALGRNQYESPRFSSQPTLPVMPQWPSMLGSHSIYKSENVDQQPPLLMPMQPIPSTNTHIALPAATTASGTVPRRTLTDEDRRKMCVYQDQHPSLKQTEIGAVFGVDRSTVSKVLRQKEKYLALERGRTIARREKGRSGDVERALSKWARNQLKNNYFPADQSIREKAAYFAAVAGGPESNPITNTAWLESFKRRCLSPATNSPRAESPLSPTEELTLLQTDLHRMKSENSLDSDRPSILRKGSDQLHKQSSSTLSSATTDPAHSTSPQNFTNPFLAHRPSQSPLATSQRTLHRLMPAAPTPSESDPAFRPRRQTCPTLDPHLTSSPSAQEPNAKYIPLDSPMQEHPDLFSLPPPDGELAMAMDGPASQTVKPVDTMRPLPVSGQSYRFESGSIAGMMLDSGGANTDVDGVGVGHDIDGGMSAEEQNQNATPSQEEVRRALEVVVCWLQKQPAGTVKPQESLVVGQLWERLKG